MVLLLTLLPTLVGACATNSEPATVLQPEDRIERKGGAFDPARLLEDAAFEDGKALSRDEVQAFLRSTPYKRPSFLETYQSNGVAASAAIVRASEIHRINPIVLLIKAQTVQGLLGEGYYPSSSDRVEYAFGCGCAGRGSCDLALAGLDKQVDCLARALRKSFDELGGKDGKTAGGWAVGVERQTLDGVKVTPGNKATAALYQYAPLVERSQGGNWLFWNLWGKYTEALTYFGPTGGRPNGSWVGDTCTKDADCTFPGGQCQSAYVGGFCTAPCNPNPCPSSGSRVETFCGSFGGVGYCTPICDPNVPASCRDGYECRGVKQSGGSLARNVCVPR